MNKIIRDSIAAVFFFFLSSVSGVTITNSTHQGQACFLILTNEANYYYQKNAGAFSSIRDLDGLDWISYDTTYKKNASGDLRGLPGLSYKDSIAHPGFAKCTTQQVNDSTIKTTTRDGNWEWSWTFSENRAVMRLTKIKSGASYSFSYNGPPANRYKTTAGTNIWGNDVTGFSTTIPAHQTGIATGRWKWGIVGDTSIQRLFYIAHNTFDTITNSFKWINGASNNGMASLVFGSSTGSNNLLTAGSNTFTIGFLEQKVRDSTTLTQCKNALDYVMQTDSVYPVYGIAVTTHWVGENSSALGDWGDIVRHDIENDSVTSHITLCKGNSAYPIISPDGKQIAFSLLNTNGQGATIAIMNTDGSNLWRITASIWLTGGNEGHLDWPKGKWIYYSDGSGPVPDINRINSENGVVEKKVMSFKDATGNPTHPWYWNMSYDGTRMIFRASDFHLYFCKAPQVLPEVITLLPQGGKYNSPFSFFGCQHSISSSGNYASYGPPTDNHNTIRIKQWWDTTEAGCIEYLPSKTLHSWGPSKFDAGGIFHYNTWSNNSDEWICAHESIKGKYEVSNMILYNWKKRQQIAVTRHTGDIPEFDALGDFHLDSSALLKNPVIRLNRFETYFRADSGLTATPDTDTILVANTNSGILGTISCRIRYSDTTDTNWLNVTTGGTGNSQTIKNTISRTTLRGGIYKAVVSVSAPNADITKIYTVYLTITTKRTFTSIKLSPATVTLAPGISQKFTATAMDQYSDTISTLPSLWLWKTDTNATISGGVFKTDSAKDTPYTITATATIDSVTLIAKAFVLVEIPALTILFPNGKERFYTGDKITIQWQAGDIKKISSVAIDISMDNGKNWYTINEQAIPPSDTVHWGRFPWIIPYSQDFNGKIVCFVSDSSRLRVRDYQSPLFRDASDAAFCIYKGITGISGPDPWRRKQPAILQFKPFAFKIVIPEKMQYHIQIVTVSGRTIFQRQGAGAFQYVFDRKIMAGGVYIAQVKTNAYTITKKVRIW